MSVIYEVNLAINPEAFEGFIKWLKEKHISDMLKNPGFIKSEVFFRNPEDEDSTDTTKKLITVQYRTKDVESIKTYIKEKSAASREEGLKLFPNQFTATRRILVHEFSKGE